MTLIRKESLILFGFALFPLILIIVSFFDTQFMQLSAPDNSMSFVTFFEAVIDVQYQTFLPLVALIYLVIVSIGDEIRSGKLILYKDIDRNSIIFSKLLSMLSIYVIYFFLTIISSLITYYTYLINQNYTNGHFLPINNIELKNSSLIILSIIVMHIYCILLSSFFSIKFNNSATLLIVSVIMLFSFVSAKLTLTSYIFPNAYPAFFDGSNYLELIFFIAFNFIFVSFFLVLINSNTFKKIEY